MMLIQPPYSPGCKAELLRLLVATQLRGTQVLGRWVWRWLPELSRGHVGSAGSKEPRRLSGQLCELSSPLHLPPHQ